MNSICPNCNTPLMDHMNSNFDPRFRNVENCYTCGLTQPNPHLPGNDEEVEWFIRAHDAGELPEPPPMNTAKLMARLCLLEDALKDANSMCRSAMAIAERDGSANWPAFRDRLRESLERQHAVMFPSQGESDAPADGKLGSQVKN